MSDDLTDEQIDDDVAALVYGESMPEETAWAIIAAVEARAARRERERIIAIMRDAAMVGECITSPHICLTDTIYEIEAARIARGEHR